jgi:hypothetical protein
MGWGTRFGVGRIAPAVTASACCHRALYHHIDFLQVRNGTVHTLDYKPDARTNRSTPSRFIKLTGVRVFDTMKRYLAPFLKRTTRTVESKMSRSKAAVWFLV